MLGGATHLWSVHIVLGLDAESCSPLEWHALPCCYCQTTECMRVHLHR